MTVQQLQQPPSSVSVADPGSLPVLWQLKGSHYNEKARWALDHKGVPHVRRDAIPGRHAPIARKLSGGDTFPVLLIDGEAIGDSSDIIAALERRHPDPALYPEDPDLRRRALEIEEFFDEELGPYTRLLLVHHVLPEPDLTLDTFVPGGRGARRAIARLTFPLVRRRIVAQFGLDELAVEHAFQKLRSAGDRFRATVGPSGYLAGAEFSVADLTLAALVAPVVAPPQFPYPQAQRDHPRVEPVRRVLAESGLLEWALGIYERHRGVSAEVRQADTEVAAA